jgi:hypothetical protein
MHKYMQYVNVTIKQQLGMIRKEWAVTFIIRYYVDELLCYGLSLIFTFGVTLVEWCSQLIINFAREIAQIPPNHQYPWQFRLEFILAYSVHDELALIHFDILTHKRIVNMHTCQAMLLQFWSTNVTPKALKTKGEGTYTTVHSTVIHWSTFV